MTQRLGLVLEPSTVDPSVKRWKSAHNGTTSTADVPQSLYEAEIPWSEYPVPQADRPEVVAQVVDAIGAQGPFTSSEIATLLGVDDRQGDYYANAAGTLGLIAPVGGGTPRMWDLTKGGDWYLDQPPVGRVLDLAERMLAVPYVQDPESVYEENVGDNTATRRKKTAQTWRTFALELSEEHLSEVERLSDELDEAREERLAVIRQIRFDAQKTQPSNRKHCECGMQLPSGGSECDFCGATS
jgi:hypothetical protein